MQSCGRGAETMKGAGSYMTIFPFTLSKNKEGVLHCLEGHSMASQQARPLPSSHVEGFWQTMGIPKREITGSVELTWNLNSVHKQNVEHKQIYGSTARAFC